MGRILSLVCIITMMSSVQTQRGFFYQRESQVAFSSSQPYTNPQSKSIQYSNQPISENLSTRSQEAKTNRIEIIPQESTRIENGTYKILNRLHLNKRGGLRTNLLAILLMELQATIGALEDSIETDNDRVVFPGPTSSTNSRRNIKLIIPKECERRGYCDNVPNYPEELVESVVAKLGDEVKRFQMDDPENVVIVQRLGGEPDISLCPINNTIIYPQSAPGKDGVWYTIINLKSKPLQGFKAELCETDASNPEPPCSSLASFPPNIKSTCVQKHVFRVMEVLDSHGVRMQMPLRLPSCCSCVLTRLP